MLNVYMYIYGIFIDGGGKRVEYIFAYKYEFTTDIVITFIDQQGYICRSLLIGEYKMEKKKAPGPFPI